METKIYIQSRQHGPELLTLIKSAVQSEVTRLELGMQLACNRLKPFEDRYRVSSQHFIEQMAAEDLSGGDDEYIQWSGEYQLMCKLRQKLQKLKDLEYAHTSLL
ncbi:MAG: hypothetical protein B6244_00445 [Candidatus Cloacimonetes bacterium 4572_55]|nr:MAG: hypothetical protein B6244_00445 [Candidatus Cloacimonetes bacterium 4572_55]